MQKSKKSGANKNRSKVERINQPRTVKDSKLNTEQRRIDDTEKYRKNRWIDAESDWALDKIIAQYKREADDKVMTNTGHKIKSYLCVYQQNQEMEKWLSRADEIHFGQNNDLTQIPWLNKIDTYNGEDPILGRHWLRKIITTIQVTKLTEKSAGKLMHLKSHGLLNHSISAWLHTEVETGDIIRYIEENFGLLPENSVQPGSQIQNPYNVQVLGIQKRTYSGKTNKHKRRPRK